MMFGRRPGEPLVPALYYPFKQNTDGTVYGPHRAGPGGDDAAASSCDPSWIQTSASETNL